MTFLNSLIYQFLFEVCKTYVTIYLGIRLYQKNYESTLSVLAELLALMLLILLTVL
jgi:hypothetical protein